MNQPAIRVPHIHPGKLLLRLLNERGVSRARLARDIGVPRTRVARVIEGKQAITADFALRLSRYFNMTPEFWMNLQAYYELHLAEVSAGEEIETTVRPYAAVVQ